MQIWQMLERAARLHPERIAVVDGEARLTYRQVARRAAGLAGHLRDRGIGPGDRIAILDDNSHEYLEAYYAAAYLGAVLVPLNVRLRPPDLARILMDAGARALIAAPRFEETTAQFLAHGMPLDPVLRTRAAPGDPPRPGEPYEAAARASPAPPGAAPEDAPAHLYYTSGTTGRPKGVILTHRNVCQHSLAAVAELRLDGADVWGHIAPMFHLADAWATFAVTWVGGRHVIVPRFDPDAVLAAITRERVTLTNLVPTMLNALVHHPAQDSYDLSSLRLVLSGGAPIAPALVRQVVSRLGCEYVQTYGMTETSPYLTLSLLTERLRALPPDEQLAIKAKTGRPFLSVQLEVVGEDGRPVAPDERQVGEIRVRGGTVSPGYWNRPEETAAAFRDGWLYTGDLAVIDPEGYVNIVDRKKDVIITGGEKVYSTEVEHVLHDHPAVREAAVYGVPDDHWGEVVRAAVVLNPEAVAGDRELTAFCRDRLAGFKVPRGFDFLDALPRTGTGKINKKGLRDGRPGG